MLNTHVKTGWPCYLWQQVQVRYCSRDSGCSHLRAHFLESVFLQNPSHLKLNPLQNTFYRSLHDVFRFFLPIHQHIKRTSTKHNEATPEKALKK